MLKIVLVLFVVCLKLSNCKLLSIEELPPDNSTLFVTEILQKWEQKNGKIGQIVLINLGKSSDLMEKVPRLLAEYPTVTVEPHKCRLISSRRAEFIILSNSFQNVSFILKFLN